MNITKIYLVTNCHGDPNKIYIGKTKNNTRYAEHKNTYGKDIIFTYIDEINSLDSKDWKPLETFWIEYFRQLGFDLQNKNKGGNGREFTTKETKLKMSKSSIGKCFKPIIQYDLEGNFIREWKSATEVNNILQLNKTNILSVCKQRSKTAFGFIWRYKNDPLPENYKLSKFDKNKKEIIQYNKLGEKIKTWNSITEASINLQINNTDISDCCLGKQKTSHGFIWRYKNDPLPENYKLPKNKMSQKYKCRFSQSRS